MLLLVGPNDKLQVVTSAAQNTDVHADHMDYDGTNVTPGRTNTPITTAATTDVVAAVASGTTRNVKSLHIRNKGAGSQTVTVQVNVSATLTELVKVTLLTGEELVWTEGQGWDHYDANGSLYASAAPSASDTQAGTAMIALQADMEAATDAVKIVTAARFKFHPSAPKFWIKSIVTTNVPAQTVSYNVASITDTATGQLTVTFTVVFSSANWCCQVSNERAATALTVASLRYVAVRFGGQAAGTVLAECWDGTAATALAVDPQAWHITGHGDQ